MTESDVEVEPEGQVTVTEVIPAALAGERLDRVVALVTGLTRVDAAALVADGRAVVGGRTVTSKAHRLAEGDEVTITWAPPGTIELEAAPDVPLDVVFEDEDVWVIDKAPGLVVHPGAGTSTGTLVQALLARDPALASVGDPARPGVVHRLDKETSGLMMVARTQAAYEALVAQLAARDVDRRYLALVWGAFDVPTGLVDAPIGRSSREPTRQAVSERGREARTHYAVRRSYTDPVPLSLVECRLETGRTHQIRVHMTAIGHPVVGDERYHGVRQSFTAPRLFLHAYRLGFVHPRTGEELSFERPLPADLVEALSRAR